MMDEQFIKEVIIKYKSFKQKLEEQIKSSEINLLNNECYLINGFWDSVLNKNIESDELSNSLIIPKQSPEFINDILIFVQYIKNQRKFSLISKEFMNLINRKLNLNLYQKNTIIYFTGNNKLIIEFKDRNEKYAILINCPLIEYQLYFIEIKKDDNRNLYKEILSIKELNEEIIAKEFNKIIFSKEEFINNKNIIVSNIKSNNISKDKDNEKINKFNKYKYIKIDLKKYNIKTNLSNDNHINYSRSYSAYINPKNRPNEIINKSIINSEFSFTKGNLNLLCNQTQYPFSSNKNNIRKIFKNKLEKEKKNKNIAKKELKFPIIEEDTKTLNELIEENEILKSKEDEYLNEINNYKEQFIKKNEEIKSIKVKFEKQINELKIDNRKEIKDNNNLLKEKIRKFDKKRREYISKFHVDEKQLKNLQKELNNEKLLNYNIERELENEKKFNKLLKNNENNIKNLKVELDNEKNKNKNLQDELIIEKNNIKNLKVELDNEKKKYKNLQDEMITEKNNIKNLEKELDNEKQINNKLKKNEIEYLNKINEYKNKLNEQNNVNGKMIELQDNLNNQNNINENNNKKLIDDLNEKINQKENELINQKNKIIFLENKLNSQNLYINMNEIISIIFISTDYNIHYSIPCINSNIFAEVEEKLYKEYPSYRETDNIFICNGNKIMRFKTISENKIKSGNIITICKFMDINKDNEDLEIKNKELNKNIKKKDDEIKAFKIEKENNEKEIKKLKEEINKIQDLKKLNNENQQNLNEIKVIVEKLEEKYKTLLKKTYFQRWSNISEGIYNKEIVAITLIQSAFRGFMKKKEVKGLLKRKALIRKFIKRKEHRCLLEYSFLKWNKNAMLVLCDESAIPIQRKFRQYYALIKLNRLRNVSDNYKNLCQALSHISGRPEVFFDKLKKIRRAKVLGDLSDNLDNKRKDILKDAFAKLKSNNKLTLLENIITKTDDREFNKLKYYLDNKLTTKMFVYFISVDQNIDCAIPCNSTDTFVELEKQLYVKYPEYRNTNNIFLYNGSTILRFKTLAENNVKNESKIMLNNK